MLRDFVKTHNYCSSITKIPLKPTVIPSTCLLASGIFFKTHSTNEETLNKPTRFNSSRTDFLLKPMSFFSKLTKEKSSDGGVAGGNVASRATSVGEARLPLTPSRSFASPAHTHGMHDTNTKRNRNRFPGCGFFHPTSDPVTFNKQKLALLMPM